MNQTIFDIRNDGRVISISQQASTSKQIGTLIIGKGRNTSRDIYFNINAATQEEDILIRFIDNLNWDIDL